MLKFQFHRRAGGRNRRRSSGPSSSSVMDRVSRRDAETQSGFLCVAFSPRLCASAGPRFRYSVVAFLFHRSAGGRNPRRRKSKPSSSSVMGQVSRRDAETQRGFHRVSFSDQRKIMCAPAGCSLMELAKNAMETGSVSGNIKRLTCTRRHPSAYVDGSAWGGLERWGRHGLKPMLRRTSTGAGTMPRVVFDEW